MLLRILLLFLLLSGIACNTPTETTILTPNLEQRTITIPQDTTLEHGVSYLPLYPQIYSYDQQQKYNLTCLVSLRNVSPNDTVFLSKIDYYNSAGKRIESYIQESIFLLPMETIDIVIDQKDTLGGTGANFLITWSKSKDCPPPLFQGVMNSMQGSQGISFTTQAIQIQ